MLHGLPCVHPHLFCAVLQYVVVVETGSDADSEAPRGSVLVNLHGEEGDTGLRPLQTSLTSSGPWSRGHADVFVLEAVSLGSLEKLELIFDGEGEGMTCSLCFTGPLMYGR